MPKTTPDSSTTPDTFSARDEPPELRLSGLRTFVVLEIIWKRLMKMLTLPMLCISNTLPDDPRPELAFDTPSFQTMTDESEMYNGPLMRHLKVPFVTKYPVGGVYIMFVNLLFVVFFAIFDWAVFFTWVKELESKRKPVPALLAAIANQGTIFTLSLLSVILLSFVIGMAVASISAQPSTGMGVVWFDY
ncbi:hypothetical protein GYMLUDRAFT_249745 [Collybiopsis luxurians FD-317 M1]|uniref:Uncharacterized protein n=1 Tax=Collybiopsis luxurians FD-317 M1 TaxID=944289 RepID=A0A0D0BWN8_9AGAR|nr:hypothetical protein GYMLUDRAFT_249745 [Collybiopsis luxurians FD-317 M1]